MPSASLILALFVLLVLLSPGPRLFSSRPRLTSKKSLLYFPYSVFKESAGAERAISLLRPPFDVKKILRNLGSDRARDTQNRPNGLASRFECNAPQRKPPRSYSSRESSSSGEWPSHSSSRAKPAPRGVENGLHSIRRRVFPVAEMRTPSGDGGRRQGERIRRRPTFPRSCPRSIIGPERLNCRVRNGNGCGPLGKVTGKSLT